MTQEALTYNGDFQITIKDPKISQTEFQEVLPKIVDFVQKSYHSIKASDILEVTVAKPKLLDKFLFFFILLGGRGFCGYCGKENSFIGFRYSFKPQTRIGGTAVLSGTNNKRLAWCHACGNIEDLDPAPSD